MKENARPPRRPGSQYLDGAELKRRREAADMTQAALAAAIDADPNHFPHWEAGRYGCGVEIVIALAAALPDCKPEDLMHEAGRRRYDDLLKALKAA